MDTDIQIKKRGGMWIKSDSAEHQTVYQISTKVVTSQNIPVRHRTNRLPVYILLKGVKKPRKQVSYGR